MQSADASFTDWLFAEAARISAPQPNSEPPAATQAQPVATSVSPASLTTQIKNDTPLQTSRPRAQAIPVFSQALNQALPSGSGQKRTASARSPSPNMNSSNKSRRMDGSLPTAPRAMHSRDGSGGAGSRSLLERMGGRSRGNGLGNRDEIQARIDAVTAQGQPGVSQEMMAQLAMNGGFPGGGMNMMPDMNAMNMQAALNGMNMGGMANPMALQEMMMNQMALMAQMATTMGILPNPQAQAQQSNGVQQQGSNAQQRRGGNVPRRGGHVASNGAQWVSPHIGNHQNNASPAPSAPSTAAPKTSTPTTPSVASPTPAVAFASRPGFTPPSRPQSPTLCKFGLKCSNALCRYAHPSPVATPESGVVLSTDACEAGKNCKDKDCIKSHVSPAAVGVTSVSGAYSRIVSPYSLHSLIFNPLLVPVHKLPAAQNAPATPQIPCRYGAGCMKINSGCPFSHPPKAVAAASAAANHFNQQCRFGASCTRAACPFQHPPGRVLPTTFHRGLDPNAPTVTVRTPETGSMGAQSYNKSVVFNKPAVKKTEDENKVQKSETLEAAA